MACMEDVLEVNARPVLTGAKVMSAECTHNLICSLHISYSIIVDIPNLLAFLCLTCLQKFGVRKNVVLRVKSGDPIESIARSVPFTVRTIYR